MQNSSLYVFINSQFSVLQKSPALREGGALGRPWALYSQECSLARLLLLEEMQRLL
jgi:hypothetical protein